tara:strand:- start:1275 stop:1391 length:117 start_codon:yes stop_codon:yes gene_type:complete
MIKYIRRKIIEWINKIESKLSPSANDTYLTGGKRKEKE